LDSPFIVEVLQADLVKLVAGSIGDEGTPAAPTGGLEPGDAAPAAGVSKTPALDQYTINLTDRARQGQIDPVIGREAEICQMVDILIRRRQNNPILTGEEASARPPSPKGWRSGSHKGTCRTH
jgi:type VI secretion system protein VasG